MSEGEIFSEKLSQQRVKAIHTTDGLLTALLSHIRSTGGRVHGLIGLKLNITSLKPPNLGALIF